MHSDYAQGSQTTVLTYDKKKELLRELELIKMFPDADDIGKIATIISEILKSI
jgi:hypothetical protein